MSWHGPIGGHVTDPRAMVIAIRVTAGICHQTAPNEAEHKGGQETPHACRQCTKREMEAKAGDRRGTAAGTAGPRGRADNGARAEGREGDKGFHNPTCTELP